MHAEGGREGLHHLVVDQRCLAPHEGLDVKALVLRTGVQASHVRADRRCAACWEALGAAPSEQSVRDRLADLGRQQSPRRRWPGRFRRGR